ncbi:MAG: DegT/DnrJ/EryC1/StrS family aminotransferase [Candidatus Woesearchaeota archaeon]|nr:DegT/DnrJ/EryC1/StrS family aminotransferase [Candidatus Woesearchaeota archaeon]
MENRYIGVGTLNLTKKAKEYVNQVLDSNRLSYGPFCKRLEKDFAKIHDSKFAVLSNSGTSSLQVALQALKEVHKWEDGDEIIVPAITFVATSNIVIHNRMKPVFVDVEKECYGIDPKKIESVITPRTRAIMPVHLFGMPCDMNPIIKIAKKHNLKIIEDSCETMFARYKGKSVGNLGDIGCFSTYVAHLLTAGVGGIATTNNPEYAVKMRSLVNHGRDSIYLSLEDDDNKSEKELKEIISKRFSFVSVGHSFRITEMEAALGVAQLEDWQEMISKRKKNAHYLIEGLKDLEKHIQLPRIRPETDHSFMLFPIVLKYEQKEELVNFLENKGIETRDMMPITNQPVYKRLFSIKEDDSPVAKWINKNGFYIGCHQDLTKEDLDYIIKVFHSFVK